MQDRNESISAKTNFGIKIKILSFYFNHSCHRNRASLFLKIPEKILQSIFRKLKVWSPTNICFVNNVIVNNVMFCKQRQRMDPITSKIYPGFVFRKQKRRRKQKKSTNRFSPKKLPLRDQHAKTRYERRRNVDDELF